MNYKIIGKYIKNLNFSIPNPKTFFLLSKEIGNYKINIDIKSEQVKQNIIEVQTTLRLTPVKDNVEIIDAKINFSTVIEITREKLEKDEIEKIVLVDVPTQIYSELRTIFINLFQNSGFKDVKISEQVDFQKLYDKKKINKNFS
tara:strand:+ start:104 stop:535 length:432 start_codon:yes stop_codon:yes gene_type:complete